MCSSRFCSEWEGTKGNQEQERIETRTVIPNCLFFLSPRTKLSSTPGNCGATRQDTFSHSTGTYMAPAKGLPSFWALDTSVNNTLKHNQVWWLHLSDIKMYYKWVVTKIWIKSLHTHTYMETWCRTKAVWTLVGKGLYSISVAVIPGYLSGKKTEPWPCSIY